MNDPDQLVRKLWRLRERLASPLAAVPYESSGMLWADTCERCGFGYHRKSAAGFEACAKCGHPWREIEGRVAKGASKHRPHTNSMERGYLELARCVSVLNHVPEPARTLYEYHLDPRGGGSRYAISAARALGICHSCTEHAFWGHLRMARELVGLRLTFLALRRAA